MEIEHGNNVLQLGPHPIILRIVFSPQQSIDWKINGNVTFHELLDVIDGYMQANGERKPTAFEYEDEEGDRITVRTDEELKAMIDWHQWNCEKLSNGIGVYPLVVYPRVGRSPSRRNTLGLTVDVTASSAQQATRQSSGGGSSGRKRHENIQTILSSGQIFQHDLQYLNVVGHGNGGTVHRAFHVPTQQQVAIKIIPLDITEEVQRQILSELDILFKCNSQFVIGFYGAFFIENKISICTEYMDGGSLDNYGKIEQNVLGRIAVAVVKGLQYLWHLKVIHRDVKPNNMLVNTQGHIKLCDFGVSIQLVNSIAKTYVGTNAYMAPERILGDEYGIHSDVWSLGLSLVEMSTGSFPYPSNNNIDKDIIAPIELLQCIVNENPPRLSMDLFGDALRDFVEICLQKNQKSRPTPEQLSRHPFILQNDTENQNAIISEFVCSYRRLHSMDG
ncbi:dual specificity mitogen-activated protein kinase kinase 5-like isoform X2 [Hydractinia symbiolongicarpus]|uniref:dual specificity mitogen-activated protein kinase kinase 5-like isoform X2 n=1 Tax=Hydractinia symbiolongicarpus TaxID=13093 RepID=UPI00254F29F0|nr:dual specificity mitogen-activated protein kinase kinase 5-like isoform X2 [Hydractinia symbiolongicarpus]